MTSVSSLWARKPVTNIVSSSLPNISMPAAAKWWGKPNACAQKVNIEAAPLHRKLPNSSLERSCDSIAEALKHLVIDRMALGDEHPIDQ